MIRTDPFEGLGQRTQYGERRVCSLCDDPIPDYERPMILHIARRHGIWTYCRDCEELVRAAHKAAKRGKQT